MLGSSQSWVSLSVFFGPLSNFYSPENPTERFFFIGSSGGPGGPTPYRIIVDSGVVLLCTIALAPSSPLVALAALVYFIVCEPLMRRNLILVYRPQFDAGGARWPYMFDIVISSLLYGGVLLTTQMLLKQAVGPAVLAALTLIPTFSFYLEATRKYKPAFDDAALLQTSLLDGWDTAEPSSAQEREEFRRFLVDAHKAAYIPVCIAGSDTDEFLTAEPAVVLSLETDTDAGAIQIAEEAEFPAAAEDLPASERTTESERLARRRRTQRGVTMRRASLVLSAIPSTNKANGGTEDELLGADHLALSHSLSSSPTESGVARTTQSRPQRGATLRRASLVVVANHRMMTQSSGTASSASTTTTIGRQAVNLEDVHYDSPFTAATSRRNLFR